MPKKLERALQQQATRKGLRGQARARYVYGTLRKTGWKPPQQRHK